MISLIPIGVYKYIGKLYLSERISNRIAGTFLKHSLCDNIVSLDNTYCT